MVSFFASMKSRGTEVQQDRHAPRPSCASRRGEHLRTRPPSTFRLCLLAVLRRAPQRLAQTCTSASIKQIFWKLCEGDKWRRKKKEAGDTISLPPSSPPLSLRVLSPSVAAGLSRDCFRAWVSEFGRRAPLGSGCCRDAPRPDLLQTQQAESWFLQRFPLSLRREMLRF